MILGDFNSHNPLWGSDHLSPKGRVIESFISQNDLCLYNDGSSTFIHSGNGTYSAIYLSFASPTLFDRFSWDVHDDCSGSDHFPFILRAVKNDDYTKPRRWKFKQADWTTFKTLCSLQLKNIHMNQMTLSLISLISYLKLLIRQYQNPRSVLNQENLGLMMNVDRQ